MPDLPSQISLREVGPRDGLQNEDPVPTAAKIELIDRLSATGVRRIEAVSFVRAEAIPQMADADEVWKGIDRAAAVRYSALVPNLRGARRALDAGLTEIEAVVSASDTHNRKNVRRSTEESLDDIAAIIDQAHQRGVSCQVIISTAWGCPYEGDVPVSRVVQVAGRAVADGADSISFGDTTGMATPSRVWSLVGEFRSAYPDTALNLHFHNTGAPAWPTCSPRWSLEWLTSTLRSAASAAARTRRERPATSLPRNWCTWCRTWASRPASTWRP